MKDQTLFTINYKVTDQQLAADLMNACRILDCTLDELVHNALEQFVNLNI